MTLTTLTIERCSYSLQHHVTCVQSVHHWSVLWYSCVWQLSWDILADAGFYVKKLPCSGMWQTRHPVKPGLWSNILKK